MNARGDRARSPYSATRPSSTSSRRAGAGAATNADSRSGPTSSDSTPGEPCGQVEPNSHSVSANPFCPVRCQNGSSNATTTLAARAWRWARSELSRSSLSPTISTDRSGPAGRAQTTASARTTSPPASPTLTPRAPVARRSGAAPTTETDSTTAPNRTRSPSSAAIASATAADPSATRSPSHAARS